MEGEPGEPRWVSSWPATGLAVGRIVWCAAMHFEVPECDAPLQRIEAEGA